MAHRIITQVILSGSRVLGRAISEAYKQAAASQKYAAHVAKTNPDAAKINATGMTLDEACRILNVKAPRQGEGNLEEVMERFKRLFDQNEPKNGGSFYLQSKVLRARERIEMDFKEVERAAEAKAAPKMYR